MAHLPRPRCRRRRGLLKVPNIAPQPARTRIQLCVHTNRSKVTKCIRCLSFWKTILMVKKQALIEGAYSLVNVNSCVVNSTTQYLIANYLFLFSKSLAYFHFAYYRLLEICNSWNGIFFWQIISIFQFCKSQIFISFRFAN